MVNKRGEMPITEIIAIILAIVVLVVGIIIAVYFQSGGGSIGNAIYRLISFSWLFGNS